MKAVWLSGNDSSELLIIFNGFGMDHKPFTKFEAPEHDILILQDYSSLALDEATLNKIKAYAHIDVLAWSLGVWVFNQQAEHFPAKTGKHIAINGTLFPLDRSKGIAPAIFAATVRAFADESGAGQLAFYKNVFADNEALYPARSRTEQLAELEFLQKMLVEEQSKEDSATKKFSQAFFDKALIAKNDLIMRPANQKLAWQGLTEVREIEAGHFLFDELSSWRDILAY